MTEPYQPRYQWRRTELDANGSSPTSSIARGRTTESSGIRRSRACEMEGPTEIFEIDRDA